jgi:hypothetical protein
MGGAEERVVELDQFAQGRRVWTMDRRLVVREFASLLVSDESIVVLYAGQRHDTPVAVLLTDRRIFIGTREAERDPVRIEVIDLAAIQSAEVGDAVAGQLRLQWSGGVTLIESLSAFDADTLRTEINRRLERKARPQPDRVGRPTKPVTELQHLSVLVANGLLTEDEGKIVRGRVLRAIAARANSPHDSAASAG